VDINRSDSSIYRQGNLLNLLGSIDGRTVKARLGVDELDSSLDSYIFTGHWNYTRI